MSSHRLYGGIVDYVYNMSGGARHYVLAGTVAGDYPGDVAVMCGRTVAAAFVAESADLDPNGVAAHLRTCRDCARRAVVPNYVTRERAAELDAAAAAVEAPPVEAPPVEAPPVEAPPVEAPPVACVRAAGREVRHYVPAADAVGERLGDLVALCARTVVNAQPCADDDLDMVEICRECARAAVTLAAVEAPPAEQTERAEGPAVGDAVALAGRAGVWIVTRAPRAGDAAPTWQARRVFTGGDEDPPAVFALRMVRPLDRSAADALGGTLGVYLTAGDGPVVVPVPHRHAGRDAGELAERAGRWQRRAGLDVDAVLVVRMSDGWYDGEPARRMPATVRPDHKGEARRVYAERIVAGAAELPPVVSAELAEILAVLAPATDAGGELLTQHVTYDLQYSFDGDTWVKSGPYSYTSHAAAHQVARELSDLEAANPRGHRYRVVEVRTVRSISLPPTGGRRPAERREVRPADAPPAAGPVLDLAAGAADASAVDLDADGVPAALAVDDDAPLARGELVTYNGARHVVIRPDSVAAVERGAGQVELYPGDALPDRIAYGMRGHWVEASACTRRRLLSWGMRHVDRLGRAVHVIEHDGRAWAELAVETAWALGEHTAELVVRTRGGGEWLPVAVRTAAQRAADARAYLDALD